MPNDFDNVTTIPTQGEPDQRPKKGGRIAVGVLLGLFIFIAGFASAWVTMPLVSTLYYTHFTDDFDNMALNEWGEEVPFETWEDMHDGNFTDIEMPDGSGMGILGTEIEVDPAERAANQIIVDKVKDIALPGFTDMEPFAVRAFVENIEGEEITTMLFLYGNDRMSFNIDVRSDETIGWGASNLQLSHDHDIGTIEDVEREWAALDR